MYKRQVLWHPNVFKSTVRFHIIEPHMMKKGGSYLQLSKIEGQKLHFLGADNVYYVRIIGERYWFQLRCENVEYVAPDAYLGLEMNSLLCPEKRLKTIKELSDIYSGNYNETTRFHLPARLQSHLKSILAYDIRAAGGSVLDVVNAFKAAKFIEENPDKFVDHHQTAMNAYRAGKAYIMGDYLKIFG